MGDIKKSISKSLVRNAEIPVPATVLTSQINKNDAGNVQEDRRTCKQSEKCPHKETVSLSQPTLNSALLIVKEMKHTSEMKPSKIPANQNFKEKISLNMNIPYNERLYHDLVEISLSDIPKTEHLACSKPKPYKYDRAPDLSEFLNPSFIPDIPVPVNHSSTQHSHAPIWDGRGVYLLTENVKNDCSNNLKYE